MPEFDRALVWLRRDLRLSDHTALAEACRRSAWVAVVFVYDTTILDDLKDRADKRVTFIHHSVEEVAQGLQEKGSGLYALHGDPMEVIPDLAEKLGADAIFCSHDDDPYALARDKQIQENVTCKFISFKDHVIFERQEVMNQSGEPFRVYTPYMRQWRRQLLPRSIEPREPDFSKLCPAEPGMGNKTLKEIGFEKAELWLEPGEAAAHQRLDQFRGRLHQYQEIRDIPSAEGTSGLSVHLRHGTLSIRTCVRAALENGSPGAEKWLNELIWRDFYHMILANFPHVVSSAFRPEYAEIKWPGERRHFEAWRDGQTGFPLVDAAMRCLNATGWMHNRLRMVCASFLTKDLLIDWREGEVYFAEKLLDFELASNSGGWQWSASVGVDAQPYFRIFNPLLQSKKFDPEGAFIREWVPELREFPAPFIHAPEQAPLMEQMAAGCEIGRDYPAPIVDHAAQKPKAIALFKN